MTETRTVVAQVAQDLRACLDLRDEGLRLAQFAYSATVMAGSKPSFRYLEDTPIHQDL